MQQILLEPEFEHPQRRESGIAGDREKIPDEVLRGIAPTQPKPCGGKARATPADRFFQVEIQAKLEEASIDRSLRQATCGVTPYFCLIAAKEIDPTINQFGSLSVPIAGYPIRGQPI